MGTNIIENINRPSKEDIRMAMSSYSAMEEILKNTKDKEIEVEIEENKERIKIPLSALKLLVDILKIMSEGKPVSIVPVGTEVTTQKAAEIIGCSRPFLVNLLEKGEIPFVKIGRHRRIKLEDVLAYRKKMKEKQKKNIIDLMHLSEDTGEYNI